MLTPDNIKIMDKIIVEFSKTIEMFGLTPLEARLFIYLYLSEQAFTLDEMSEALGKSKTSMSTNIRSLLELNLVTRVWKKGIRKDLYEANTQLFKAFMNTYLSRWIDATKQQLDGLEGIKQLLTKEEENASIINQEQLMNRLDNIISFHLQIEKLFKEMNQNINR
ncbi:GbsR/MarR family transcriptional regulator [Oceanobacillus chungangensis]|uniref:HTH-type transcriptional regulator n=1 Tax=Oceanobacillus chungangensis TaxID=1229152 RepID=A0A3D8PX52_9BACI|nr:MarR family transcriptional regulator [Oceanobacillus chungangensis]RDW19891.1 transcriptional regulator [Oceanobacillus chungangensis]